MDCKTARLMLECARPNNRELDAAETRALEDHLAGCDDCGPLAQGERRADEVLGKAMRQVDVPDQLRGRLLVRLKEQHGERRRRRLDYGVRIAAAVAAGLLLALGLWHWYAVRPAFPVENLLAKANIAPPSRDDVEQALKGQGVTGAPDLNYSYLRWLFMTDVDGRPTPLLVFNNGGRQALVFVVPDTRFDVNALPSNLQKDADYEYKCKVQTPQAGAHFGYVVYFTGNDVAWLDPPLAPPPTVGEGN
jgi:hypothetical protein